MTTRNRSLLAGAAVIALVAFAFGVWKLMPGFASRGGAEPADSMESAMEYVRKTIADPRVELTALQGMEPSRISKSDGEAYRKVADAVEATWPGSIATPYLMVQCSDSRHYGAISDRVYRFSAMDLTKEERGLIHGNDERIRVETVGKAVEFYIRLMRMC